MFDTSFLRKEKPVDDPKYSASAREWLRNYSGSIDATALLEAYDAGRTSQRQRIQKLQEAGRMLNKRVKAYKLSRDKLRTRLNAAMSIFESVHTSVKAWSGAMRDLKWGVPLEPEDR